MCLDLAKRTSFNSEHTDHAPCGFEWEGRDTCTPRSCRAAAAAHPLGQVVSDA